MTLAGIVLAAGQGTRMKSTLPKVAHDILGKQMILWPLDALRRAGVSQIAVVISPLHDVVAQCVKNYSAEQQLPICCAYQEVARGTGDAARVGLAGLKASGLPPPESFLVTVGDTPLVTTQTFSDFFAFHKKSENAVSILGFEAANPFGYGRILQDASGEFLSIREQKDCTEEEARVRLCNSGIMCVAFSEAEGLLADLTTDNRAQEYYLTEVPALARKRGLKVGVSCSTSEDELRGVNTQEQLAEVTAILQRKLQEQSK